MLCVGIGIMIKNVQEEILLIKRNVDPKLAKSDMHLEGTWTLPAGKIKYGETLIEAAKRKVKEEVNLEVNSLKIISIADDINEHAHFLTIGLYTESFSGDIDLGNTEEHTEYKFFRMCDLPQNLCEPSQKIIKNYLENKIY